MEIIFAIIWIILLPFAFIFAFVTFIFVCIAIKILNEPEREWNNV